MKCVTKNGVTVVGEVAVAIGLVGTPFLPRSASIIGQYPRTKRRRYTRQAFHLYRRWLTGVVK